MTIKYMNKKNMQLIDGFLCNKKGHVLGINPKVAELANALDTMVQKKLYLDKQPDAQPMPSLDGFKRRHMHELVLPQIKPAETPVTDKRVAEAMAFVHEVEDQHTAGKVNEMVKEFAMLFDFANNDKIWVDTDVFEEYEFDTPELGNPLDYDAELLLEAIMFIHDADIEFKED